MSKNNTRKSYKTVQKGGAGLVFCPGNFNNPPNGTLEELFINIKNSDDTSKALELVRKFDINNIKDKNVEFLLINELEQILKSDKLNLSDIIEKNNKTTVSNIINTLKLKLISSVAEDLKKK